MLALASALASFVFALPAAVQAPQFELQLVRADAGPVAGAQVRWFEGEAPRDDLGAFEAAALASGKLALADERGRVVIAGERERLNIAASLPGWWGYMYSDGAGSVVIDGERRRLKIAGNPRGNEWSDVQRYVQRYAWLRDSSGHAAQHREDSSSLSLVLHADRELDFHVVDREGVGVAGVPVLLRSSMNAGVRSLRAVSGVNGRGAFRHASAWWAAESESSRRVEPFGGADEEGESDTNAPRTMPLFVVSTNDWPTLEVESLPHSSRRRIELGKELPSEPVVVSASDLTEVVLSVRTAADVAPLDGGWVTDPDDWTRFPLVAPVGGIAGVSQARLWVHADSAPIALYARRNSTSAEYPFSIWRPAVLAARAEVVVGRDHRTLRARPLIDGRVRPHTEFTLVWEHPGDHGYYRPRIARVTSDASGDLLLDIELSREPERLLVVYRAAASRDLVGLVASDAGQDNSAEIALAPRNEFILALADDRGTPLADAQANVWIGDEYVTAEPNHDEPTWRNAVASRSVDEYGRTRVTRTDWSYVDLLGSWGGNLSVSADGYATAESHFDAQTKHLRLVLPREARVSGRIRSANPDKLSQLDVLLLRREEGVPEKHAPGFVADCGRDGSFEFSGLRSAGDQSVVPLRPTESYTLSVRRVVSGARPVELTRREGLLVGPGETLDVGEIVID
jgi:hypothetical protein